MEEHKNETTWSEYAWSWLPTKDDLRTLIDLQKQVRQGVDLYPIIKGSAMRYMNETSHPSMTNQLLTNQANPMVTNMMYGYMKEFLPKWNILLHNIIVLKSPEVAGRLVQALGCTEIISRKLVRRAVGAQGSLSQELIKAVMMQLSSPLQWVTTIVQMARLGADVRIFFLEGGLLNSFGTGLFGTLDLPPEIVNLLRPTLNLTIRSCINDLSRPTEETEDEDRPGEDWPPEFLQNGEDWPQEYMKSVLVAALIGHEKPPPQPRTPTTARNVPDRISNRQYIDSLDPIELLLSKFSPYARAVDGAVGFYIGKTLAPAAAHTLLQQGQSFEPSSLFPPETLKFNRDDNEVQIVDEEMIQDALQFLGERMALLTLSVMSNYIREQDLQFYSVEQLYTVRF